MVNPAIRRQQLPGPAVTQSPDDRLQGAIEQHTVVKDTQAAFFQSQRQAFTGFLRHLHARAIHKNVFARGLNNGGETTAILLPTLIEHLKPAALGQITYQCEMLIALFQGNLGLYSGPRRRFSWRDVGCGRRRHGLGYFDGCRLGALGLGGYRGLWLYGSGFRLLRLGLFWVCFSLYGLSFGFYRGDRRA